MAVHMQQLLKQAGHDVPVSRPVLEINPGHPLVSRLRAVTDTAEIADWAGILFDEALLSEGGQLQDPVAFVNRVNLLLQSLTN